MNYQKGDYIGAYKVLELLASSSQSNVYLVYSESLNSRLAIKVLHDKTRQDLFLQQARIMHAFSDQANIVRLMHIGDDQGLPFLLMPFYRQNLASYLAAYGTSIDPHTSLTMIKSLLRAVETIHERGVIHLDIKPQNILLDDADTLYLNDFDAARVTENSALYAQIKKLNAPKRFTPEYCSPECFLSTQVLTAQSDLFSVGIVWCRMLVGDTTFKQALATTAHVNLERVNNTRSKLLEALQGNVPNWMHELISNLLQIDPSQRPVSASFCLRHIDNYLQVPEDYETILVPELAPADALISTTMFALAAELENQLLEQGDVSDEELENLRVLFASDEEPLLEKDMQAIKAYVCQKLARERDLGAWFEWCARVAHTAKLSHKKGGKILSSEQLDKLLSEGKNTRPDKPELAVLFLEKHLSKMFNAKNSNNVNKITLRYLLPLSLICIVFLFWFVRGVWFPENFEEQNYSLNRLTSSVTQSNPQSEKQARFHEEDIDQHVEKNTQENNVRLITLKTQNGANALLRLRKIFYTNQQTSLKSSELNKQDYFYVMEAELSVSIYNMCVADGFCSLTKKYSTNRNTPNSMKLDDENAIPMTEVSWYEVNEQFIPWINMQVRGQFTLPNLEQWKMMAGWPKSILSLSKLRQTSVCKDCSLSKVRSDIRTKKIHNPLGLLDVYGNVQEWLLDCGQDGEIERCDQAIVAGGSWFNRASDIQKQPLNQLFKQAKTPMTGFRLVYIPDD